jgi:putative transposase
MGINRMRTAHNRHTIRLRDRDYSQPGAYFITLVTRGRECLFGEIKNGSMCLNEAGQIVRDVWNTLHERYPQIDTGTAAIMPNHFHGIVMINETQARVINELSLPIARRRMTLPLVVGYFKTNTAKRINKLLHSEGIPVWQRNYYERVIRNDDEHHLIHLYIEANAANWQDDEENPVKPI